MCLVLVARAQPSREVGCCRDEQGVVKRERVVENIFAAVVGAGLLGGLEGAMPMKSRWGSRAAVLAMVLAGQLFHDVLGRGFARAFPHVQRPVQLPQDEDDFHKILKSKVARAGRFLRVSCSDHHGFAVSLATEPVDHLMRRLQYLDHRGGVLQHIMSDSGDPFAETLRAYFSRLAKPHEFSGFGSLFGHFGEMAEQRATLSAMARSMCCALAAQVWRHFQTHFTAFPYRLVAITLETKSDEDKCAIDREFCALPMCCLDEHFGQKAQQLAIRAGGVQRHQGLMEALRLWGQEHKVCNMHVERLLALIRKAAPKGCVAPRLCSAGTLIQATAAHRKAGGLDPRGATRSASVGWGEEIMQHALAEMVSHISAIGVGAGRDWRMLRPSEASTSSSASRRASGD